MTSESLPISDLVASFELHLRAKNRADKTIRSYLEAVTQLIDHAGDRPADQITKADIEAYLASVLERNAPATARQRYASLVQFWKWAHEDGEVPEDPMERIQPPQLVEQPVPVLTPDDLRAPSSRHARATASKNVETKPLFGSSPTPGYG